MKKALLILACLLLSAAIYKSGGGPAGAPGAGRGAGGGRPDGAARAVPVESAPLTRQRIVDTRRFTGTLRPERGFDIASKIGARVLELKVELGQPIRSRQELVRLDDEEFRVTLREREAELEVALATLRAREAKIGLLESEQDRARHLRDRKMASEAEFQKAAMDLATAIAEREVAQAQVRQREAAVEAARVRLGYCTLFAPDDIDDDSFYVGERFVDAGALVRVNDPLLRLVSIDRLVARIHVIERDYQRIRVGMEAILETDAYPGRSFPAQVVRISPLVDEGSRQAPVELAVRNLEYRLKPGMFVRATLTLDEHDQVLVAPHEALTARNGREGVYRVSDAGDRADFVPLTIGIRAANGVEILKPENFSGEVVLLGHHLLGPRGGPVVRAGAVAPEERRGGGGRERRSGTDGAGTAPAEEGATVKTARRGDGTPDDAGKGGGRGATAPTQGGRP